jgi:hypothetical protein
MNSSPACSEASRERHDFDVRVPVTRGRTVTHVLTATVKPEAMHDLLATQRLPADWVGVLLDADRRIVARTVSPERTVGQRASDSLRAALDRAPEGWFHGSTIEGDVVYTPYNRSPFSGWTVAIGIPLPRALLLALGLSTVLYVAVAVAAVSVQGAEALGASPRPLADVMAHDLGGASAGVVAAIALSPRPTRRCSPSRPPRA